MKVTFLIAAAFIFSLLLAFAVTASGSARASPQNTHPGEFTEDIDWTNVDTSILDVAYINPRLNFRHYKKIYIKQPEIHFHPNWVAKFGESKSSAYRQEVARRYASLLEEAIAETFSRDTHLSISDQRGDDILVIIPKVIELYIAVPDSVVNQDVIITTPAGSAKIDLVIYSPRDQSVLGLFMDTRSTSTPRPVEASKPRMINTRAFNRLFKEWSEDLVAVLEK